jgi:hypothetical protein
MKKEIKIIIEKWNNSDIPYSVYIGEKYFEDLSKDMLIGLIVNEIENLK